MGIDNALKNTMHERWEAWMARDGIVNRTAKEPSCKQVTKWSVDAYTNIPKQVSSNAWMESDYAWFKFILKYNYLL
jgi:hypothetical protein